LRDFSGAVAKKMEVAAPALGEIKKSLVKAIKPLAQVEASEPKAVRTAPGCREYAVNPSLSYLDFYSLVNKIL
jgi:hypothetical protein